MLAAPARLAKCAKDGRGSTGFMSPEPFVTLQFEAGPPGSRFAAKVSVFPHLAPGAACRKYAQHLQIQAAPNALYICSNVRRRVDDNGRRPHVGIAVRRKRRHRAAENERLRANG
jgi:hypothetical protein